MKKERKLVKSKRDCFCTETGKPIKIGDEVLFLPETKNVVCKDSELYKEFVRTMKQTAQPFKNIVSFLLF